MFQFKSQKIKAQNQSTNFTKKKKNSTFKLYHKHLPKLSSTLVPIATSFFVFAKILQIIA